MGSVVDRRYRLKREIARGGAGAVFEAEHLYTTRSVAIKLLIEEQADTSESRTRLLLEARALSVARHPGIVQGLDAGETEDGTPYLAMELLEGRTLEGILAVRRRVGVADTINVGMQLCDALGAAHAHEIFHRDIKPSNIFISRNDAGREVAKIFDFGIAHLYDQDRKITQKGAVLGTPEYMAPEQLLATDQVDARCDVYALGITLYEALAGVVPFEGSFGEVLLKVSTEPLPSLCKRCPEVPPDLEKAIAKALARDPADRYPSVRAFAEALSQITCGEITSLLGIRVPVPPPMPVSQRGAVLPAPAPVPPRPASVGMPSIAGAAAPLALPAEPAQAAQPATRRRFARAPYVTPARIFLPDGGTLDGRSEDISIGGLLVLAPQAFSQEEKVKVRFALPITGKLLEVPATARWVKMARGTGAVGLEFAALAPDHQAVIENYVAAMGGE
ncbi:MAG TPA: serine/threonine-protein kinase [Polyangiaceae bacterium]|nr:serine/threonine-protein kinase [Polyangiaceae bacterium]